MSHSRADYLACDLEGGPFWYFHCSVVWDGACLWCDFSYLDGFVKNSGYPNFLLTTSCNSLTYILTMGIGNTVGNCKNNNVLVTGLGTVLLMSLVFNSVIKLIERMRKEKLCALRN